jgi:hypothetical protein
LSEVWLLNFLRSYSNNFRIFLKDSSTHWTPLGRLSVVLACKGQLQGHLLSLRYELLHGSAWDFLYIP